MEKRLKEIIKDYKNSKRKNPDKLIDLCKSLPLNLAIRKAALARYGNGEKHPHQELIDDQILKKFADNLVQDIDLIEQSKSFSDLLDIVSNARINGIGALTIYDTAHRIGAKLGVFPDYVYLHRGTLFGAISLFKQKEVRNLLKLEGSIKHVAVNKLTEKLSKKDFPKIFHSLECFEIEDILCIYKKYFDLKKEFVSQQSCESKEGKSEIGCG